MILRRSNIRLTILVCVGGILALFLPDAEAFIPTTTQLLYLMTRALGKPSGLILHQTRLIPEQSSLSLSETLHEYSFTEKLTISCPGNLRADILSGPNTGYSVESDKNFVKVMNQAIIAVSKSLEDHYTDIILCRDPEDLEAMLELLGVDTAKVGYGRYQETICYVIGGPGRKDDCSGLWIDHESFLPVRYRVNIQNQFIDFLYGNWQKFSRVWYPMHITMLMNNRIITKIETDHVDLTDPLDRNLFDIQKILRKYPKEIGANFPDPAPPQPDIADRIKELDKNLKDFKKIYE